MDSEDKKENLLIAVVGGFQNECNECVFLGEWLTQNTSHAGLTVVIRLVNGENGSSNWQACGQHLPNSIWINRLKKRREQVLDNRLHRRIKLKNPAKNFMLIKNIQMRQRQATLQTLKYGVLRVRTGLVYSVWSESEVSSWAQLCVDLNVWATTEIPENLCKCRERVIQQANCQFEGCTLSIKLKVNVLKMQSRVLFILVESIAKPLPSERHSAFYWRPIRSMHQLIRRAGSTDWERARPPSLGLTRSF